MVGPVPVQPCKATFGRVGPLMSYADGADPTPASFGTATLSHAGSLASSSREGGPVVPFGALLSGFLSAGRGLDTRVGAALPTAAGSTSPPFGGITPSALASGTPSVAVGTTLSAVAGSSPSL